MDKESQENMNRQDLSLEERRETFKREIMSQLRPPNAFNNKKRIGRGKGTFVERDLFESDAFWALSGAASQMLIYFLGKREFRRTGKKDSKRLCVNTNNLTLSYIELKKLGVTQPRATRGFDALLAKGFIEIAHAGGGCQGDESVYALSNKWMFWKKGAIFSKRPNVVKRGFQGGPKR